MSDASEEQLAAVAGNEAESHRLRKKGAALTTELKALLGQGVTQPEVMAILNQFQ